jgi:hypothetical protein
MTAIIPVGIIATVVAFIIAALGNFPMIGPDTSQPDPNDTKALAQAASDRIGTAYNSIITDLMSYQQNPDRARAEATRKQFLTYAQNLAGQYQTFASQMGVELNNLTAQAEELAAQQ